MIQIKLKQAQNGWLEVTWADVEQLPNIITPAQPALYDAGGNEVQAATPETITQGGEKRTELKHTSYHPTQIVLLRADSAIMGTPLDAHAETLAAWVADYVPEPLPPADIPAQVTMRQARLALLQAGKLAAVNASINALPSPQKEAAQIEWEYSQEVQRHNGFVSQLAPLLGMTNDDLDGLFSLAGSL